MREIDKQQIIQAFKKNKYCKNHNQIYIPELSNINWTELEYFGWQHRSGNIAYLIAEFNKDLLGIELRIEKPKSDVRYKMCSICNTLHIGSGISLFSYTIKRPIYKTFADYFCSNLNCADYILGKLITPAVQIQESLSKEDKLIRLKINLNKFLENYVENTGYSITPV